jgi:hypothetical protein
MLRIEHSTGCGGIALLQNRERINVLRRCTIDADEDLRQFAVGVIPNDARLDERPESLEVRQ